MATADDYGVQIQQLLPRGKAWSRDAGSATGQMAAAMGEEFARLEARTIDLLNEADPRTADEMLGDWERVCGLPDPDLPVLTTLADRRIAVVQHLVNTPGLTQADMIALAALAGWSAQIVTHTPFAADVSAAEDLLFDDLSVFWWEMIVFVPEGAATPIANLEHYVQRGCPPHTFVTFTYVTIVEPSLDFDFTA